MFYLVKVIDSQGVYTHSQCDSEATAEWLAEDLIYSGTIAWIQEVAE